MNEIIEVFTLAASGCLVRLSTDLVLQLFARKLPSGTIVTGPTQGQSPEAASKADPLMTLWLTVGCYGAIALALVSELPGAFAFQRTWLAFAFLCVGGLIGEISRAGTNGPIADADADADAEADEREPAERTPTSVGLSVALMLALDLAVAVLVSGQGLMQIVPPPATASADQGTELAPIVVVAHRGSEERNKASSFL